MPATIAKSNNQQNNSWKAAKTSITATTENCYLKANIIRTLAKNKNNQSCSYELKLTVAKNLK